MGPPLPVIARIIGLYIGGGGGCHVPARPYVPASLDHLRVEGHDLRDAQGRTGT